MIEDALKRLGKHSLIYALGPAVHRVIGFALVPVVTHLIGSTANYGVVEQAAIMLAVAGQLFGINLVYGMSRYYNEYETERDKGRLVSTTMWLLAASTGVAWIAAVLLRETSSRHLLGGSSYSAAVPVIGAILFFQTIGQVNLRYVQILERSVLYGALTTAKLLVEVGLKVWLLLVGMTFMGVLYSVLGGEVLIALGLGAYVLRRVGVAFSWAMAGRLFRYSYPLILSGLLMFVLHQADRYFVLGSHGIGEVGVYGLGYKLGSMVNVMMLDAFGLIWFPYVFSLRDDAQVRALCRKVLNYVTALMCVASLALAVFSVEVVTVMADAGFRAASRPIPLVALGYVCWAVFQLVHTAFYVRERTILVTVLVAAAAILNLALNAAWVPSGGSMGAAWATLATFAALAVAAWILSERVMPVGYEIRRVLAPIGAGIALYGASAFLPGDSRPATLALKLLLVLALPVLLWFAGFLDGSEKQTVKRVLSEARASLVRRARRSSS